MTTFETIIIGNGLIGSAAARYLSEIENGIAIIGQDEPSDSTKHEGVFASHYDQRRLAHVFGRAGHWIDVKRRAIGEYRDIEDRSGIRFYDPVGFLMTIPPEWADDPEAPHQIAESLDIPYAFYPAGDRSWRDQFPDYDFPTSHAVLHEPETAGAIDPRKMRDAQLAIAKANGATILSNLVVDVRKQQGLMHVHTQDGQVLICKKVLLTTGAFTNCFDLLPQKLALMPKSEVVVWGEIAEEDHGRLSQLPTANYRIDDPEIMEIYMTPAARHANGRTYVKLGANSVSDLFTDDLAEIQRWFRHGDSDALLPAFRRALTGIMPNTNFLSFETKRCIITRTSTTYPMIDQVADHLFVAVGGNGGSAQCAGEWGRMSAELVHQGHWSGTIPRSLMQAAYK